MDFKRFKLTSKLFLLVAFANFIFAFIVKGFLMNPDMGKNFKGFNKQFFVSDIYLYIGLIWLIFAVIYLLDDYSGREYLSGILKKLHFYLTLPAIIFTNMYTNTGYLLSNR